MLLAAALLAQSCDLSTSYEPREGVNGRLVVRGTAKLPEGAVVEVTLVQEGDVDPAKIGPEMAIVSAGKFQATFSTDVCGPYRVEAVFRKLFQERPAIAEAIGASLKEFATSASAQAGTTAQWILGVQRDLRKFDSIRERIEKAVADAGSAPAAEVCPRLDRLGAELTGSLRQTHLRASWRAAMLACQTWSNYLGIESHRGGGGRPASSELARNDDLKGQGRAAPGVSRKPVDLQLEGVVARETARTLVRALVASLKTESGEKRHESLRRLAEAHETLASVREPYRRASEGVGPLMDRARENRDTDSLLHDAEELLKGFEN
jgi:hypothetical protein